MQIDPQYTIPLVYILTDPNDSSTYYIRAIVRDSLSGATLNSINLSLSSISRRYTSSVLSPADPTGQGRHIDITISVYTDSSYTVPSAVYQEQVDKYLVKRTLIHSSGGGSDVDYVKLKKVIKEVLDEQEKLEIEPVDLSPILTAIENIEIPEAKDQEKIELEPIVSAVNNLGKTLIKKIDDIEIPEVPEQEKVELEPVTNAILEVKKVVEEQHNASMEKMMKIELGQKNSQRLQEIKKLISEVEQDDSNEVMKPKTSLLSGYLDKK